MLTRAVASLWEWLIRGETAIPGGREVFKVLERTTRDVAKSKTRRWSLLVCFLAITTHFDIAPSSFSRFLYN